MMTGRNRSSVDYDRDIFEKSLNVSLNKAINVTECAIKEKHARIVIIASHKERSGSSYWYNVRKLPLQDNPLIAWKFCHVTHKLLRDGHPNVIKDSLNSLSFIRDLGKLWGHLKEGYGVLIASYTHLLYQKLLFHQKHHRKKLQGRRLDFDCKKRRQEKGPQADEELKQAEEKFDESKQLTEIAMHNLFDNDVEQVVQLQSFIEAELSYHRQSADILEALQESLKQKCTEAANRPRKEYVPKKAFTSSTRDLHNDEGVPVSGPSCEALYDFEAENEGELGFKEGDIIQLLSHIDENWLEGTINGQVGYFPTNYVKVLVDLP